MIAKRYIKPVLYSKKNKTRNLLQTVVTICCMLITTSSVLANGGGVGGGVTPPTSMPSCTNTAPAGNTACAATPICDLNGYCGSTSASYSADFWPELNQEFQACTNVGYDQGSIENNSFLSFVASASTITFKCYVYGCSTNDGIQMMFFAADNCGSGPVTSLHCEYELKAQATPYDITINNLTPGKTYYIMMDGYSGKECQYTFVAQAGVQTGPPPLMVDPSAKTVCTGAATTVNLTASGGSGSYTWSSADPGLGGTSGNSVAVTPPTTPGTYEYVVESTGSTGTGVCATSTSMTDTAKITVQNCCDASDITAKNLSICGGGSVDLKDGITANPDGANFTFYASSADAQTKTNPLGNTVVSPPAPGKDYWVSAATPSNPNCDTIIKITVSENSGFTFEVTANDPVSCAANGEVIVSGLAPNTSYDISYNGYPATPMTTDASRNVILSVPPGKYSHFSVTSAGGGTATQDSFHGVDTLVVAAGSHTVADFSAQPNPITTSNPEVHFTNTSSNATGYVWYFGDGSPVSNAENPVHTYPSKSKNQYIVTLIARSEDEKCNDTATMVLEVEDNIIYYVPNTFTPDNDPYNETFKPAFTAGFDPQDYTLKIYNRWGELLFVSHNVNVGWNGTYGGKLVQDGAYVWKITFKELATDKHHIIMGNINLLR